MARGDHIKARRAGGLYTHHGIDMGDGTVVHFSGDPLHTRDASVCRVSMEDFLQGDPPIVVEHNETVLHPDQTVRLAESMIGGRHYHPITNNCEHFTTYCKTGRKDSAQARRFVKAAVAAGIAALAVGIHVVRRVNARNRPEGAKTLAKASQQPKKRQKRT